MNLKMIMNFQGRVICNEKGIYFLTEAVKLLIRLPVAVLHSKHRMLFFQGGSSGSNLKTVRFILNMPRRIFVRRSTESR